MISDDTPLSAVGENALLARLLPLLPSNGALLHGAGDDCAVVLGDAEHDVLLKTDVVVESIHFTRDTAPERIGHKALARALSDIAAMGGWPQHALVTLLTHKSRPVGLVEGLYRGMRSLAQRYGVSIAGGETASLPTDGLVVNIALTGTVERGKAVLRSTGRPGDVLFVTGRLGGSFESGRHLDFEPRLNEARALLAAGLRPTAMMDLSDGLAVDLPRLAAASHCGFEVDMPAIPCNDGRSTAQALQDGEDYELLLALSPADAQRVATTGVDCQLFRIGVLTENSQQNLGCGWQHFCR